MPTIVDSYLAVPTAENNKKIVKSFLVNDVFTSGPFVGMSYDEASDLERDYELELKRHAKDIVSEQFWYFLSEGKTLNELFHMWAWAPTKQYGFIKLTPNWAQDIIGEEIEKARVEERPCYIFNLKARQWGITTYLQIIKYYLNAMHEYTNGLTMAHKREKVSGIFKIQKESHKAMPFKPRVKFTRNGAEFLKTHSSAMVESAEDDEPARSSSYRWVHQSEPAFYSRPELVDAAVASTLPDRGFFLWYKESTANGAGNSFYEGWKLAEQGKSDYIALFFPWWKHPEYSYPLMKGEEPEYEKSKLDPEELDLVSQFSLSKERLKWRRTLIRTKLSGDIDKFHQEYPSTPLEAFLTSGRPAFDRKGLLALESHLDGVDPVFSGDIVELAS